MMLGKSALSGNIIKSTSFECSSLLEPSKTCVAESSEEEGEQRLVQAQPLEIPPFVTLGRRSRSISGSSSSDSRLAQEIARSVLRQKLSHKRHLVLKGVLCPEYVTNLFETAIVPLFEPQQVFYNGGIAQQKEWKISCYLEVMDGGVPQVSNPHLALKAACEPLLQACNTLFQMWYRQQHPGVNCTQVKRLMTFITRYTAHRKGEEALLKHIDGAGKVDGSLVVALPTDQPYQGGGLTFWDGKKQQQQQCQEEIFYDTQCGDVAWIDRAVWHQANPITQGRRWALVIFYKVLN
jgi:hypothetical protein